MTHKPMETILDHLAVHRERRVLVYSRKSSLEIPFADLREQVTATAREAARLGITAAAKVAMIAPNGHAPLVMDLALLQIGCTAIHLPEGAASTMLRLIGEHNLDLIMTAEAYEHAIDKSSCEAVGNLLDLGVYRVAPAARARDLGGYDGPAIVFSSGTSGKIKQIRVDGGSVAYNANAFFRAFGPQTGDLFLLFLPLSNYQQKLLTYGCILFGIDICLTDTENVLAALKNVGPSLFLAPPIFYETAWRLAQISAAPPAGPGRTAGGPRQTPAEWLKDYFGGRMRMMWSGMAPIAPSILQGYQAAGVPLYEAYGMTEYGPITINLPSGNRIGSVGRELVPGSVHIAEDGEIILRSPHPLTLGYLGEARGEERQIYLGSGEIATGDIGHRDEEGYLFLHGRKNEIIVTSGGYKIHPQLVERAFSGVPHIDHAVLMGTGRPHLGLLLMVKAIEPSMKQMISEKIAELNAGVCQLAPIKKWRIEVGEFSVDNQMLTRNLKLARGKIRERYEDRIFS